MFMVDKSLNNCHSEWHSVWEPMSTLPHRKLKKKVAEESNSDTLFFEKLENLIIQVLEKGEYVESKLKKKVNYLYLKNIIFNS